MSTIKLNIPILVQSVPDDNEVYYHIRPLFLDFPIARHRRYEMALALFQKEVKHLFKGYVFSRENSELLLWFLLKSANELQIALCC